MGKIGPNRKKNTAFVQKKSHIEGYGGLCLMTTISTVNNGRDMNISTDGRE